MNAGRNGSAKSAKNGVCVERGKKGKVSGGLGSLIVIAIEDDNYNIKDWNAAVVDGKKIKPDTWYTLKDSEFVEVGENDEET